MTTVAFIPVRGGSVSIPLKNIKPMCGKPLVYWTAKAANDCPEIDKVVIATDSDDIKQVAEGFGFEKLEVVDRGAETATNTASTESVMLEYATAHAFDTMVLIQATSPLLSSADLSNGMVEYTKPDVDGVLSVVKDKSFYWRTGADGTAAPINYDVYARPRRQDFDGCFKENGAFYISSRERLLSSGNRVSGRLALAVMPPETAFEIDEPEDWIIIEALLKRRIKPQPFDFSRVKMFLTDCDGCLTDGGMYYTESGDELKKFNTRDGMAFQLLRERGIKVGIITSENSEAVRKRAAKLKLDFLELGCKNKLQAVTAICEQEGITLGEVVYIGDDINDIALLSRVGISCCPNDAQVEVSAVVQYIAQAKGGDGVIREVARLVLGEAQAVEVASA